MCVCVLATFETKPRTKSNDAHSCVYVKYLHYACVLCNILGENCHFYHFLAKTASFWLFLSQKVSDFLSHTFSLSPLHLLLFYSFPLLMEERRASPEIYLHFVKPPRQISLCVCAAALHHTCLCFFASLQLECISSCARLSLPPNRKRYSVQRTVVMWLIIIRLYSSRSVAACLLHIRPSYTVYDKPNRIEFMMRVCSLWYHS